MNTVVSLSSNIENILKAFNIEPVEVAFNRPLENFYIDNNSVYMRPFRWNQGLIVRTAISDLILRDSHNIAEILDLNQKNVKSQFAKAGLKGPIYYSQIYLNNFTNDYGIDYVCFGEPKKLITYTP